MQIAIYCERGISAQLRSADSEIRMESENSGMISLQELVEQQCNKEWMNREKTIIAESHWGRTERIENVWWVEKGCVAMCILRWKRWMNGVAQHSKCRLVGSVRRKRKKKKESERDGRNCRGLWCMKQCRIWMRLGNAFGKKRRKLDGKVDLVWDANMI